MISMPHSWGLSVRLTVYPPGHSFANCKISRSTLLLFTLITRMDLIEWVDLWLSDSSELPATLESVMLSTREFLPKRNQGFSQVTSPQYQPGPDHSLQAECQRVRSLAAPLSTGARDCTCASGREEKLWGLGRVETR